MGDLFAIAAIVGAAMPRCECYSCRAAAAAAAGRDITMRRISIMKTSGSAKWSGGLKDGKGAISTKSGALADYPYGFASRFEGKPGTNPEELIGAAHAGCFTMALSLILGEAKLVAESMATTAEVTLEKVADGFAITAVHLSLQAKIPGIDQATFEDLAGKAKAGCPVSKLLNTRITLDTRLLT
jgi:osmotically inducible protein OsmC